MQRQLLILVLLFIPLAAHAQQQYGTLEGTVSDASTGDPLPGANVLVRDASISTNTNVDGRYRLENIPPGTYAVVFSFVGFEPLEVENVVVEAGAVKTLDAKLEEADVGLEEITVTATRPEAEARKMSASVAARGEARRDEDGWREDDWRQAGAPFNREQYGHIAENDFRSVRQHPRSTFSIDVDAASYSNVRRFLHDGHLPPADAVRVEELINYFSYDYPQPKGQNPFSVVMEAGPAPWAPAHQLVHVGIQGRALDGEERPASNLVFLVDVSGSMRDSDKLPLLKRGFHLLVDALRPEDRVAIVVYAGAAGLVLPSTPGADKATLHEAIDRLEAGGSTAGAAGIRLAYDVARRHHVDGGNNRVILATDGDFNVGLSSDGELIRLIEKQREQNTFLTVLGFGTGNLQDHKMEQIADHGNGNYFYIDTEREARKVLARELGATLFAIAKDVKIQIEFNPALVEAYRLIGYENRLLADEDFDDDTKDAGELGAGHSVTALYEVIPAGALSAATVRQADDLVYQQTSLRPEAYTGELMTLKLRYKKPDGHRSRKIVVPVRPGRPDAARSDDFTFSAAVAAFGMLLRDSEHKGEATPELVLSLAEDAQGDDPFGYRAEFIDLVERFRGLQHDATAAR